MFVTIRLLTVVAVGFSATTSRHNPSPGCVYKGTTYHTGQKFKPTPCSDCYCGLGGSVSCTGTLCPQVPCMNATHDPTECCPVCPKDFHGCVHNGTRYNLGQKFQPNPCEHCSCDHNGQALCLWTACRFPSCVDSVRDPSECCPTCPNGENCRSFDGTIVKKGEKYHPDSKTTCECSTNEFGLTSPMTICQLISEHTYFNATDIV